jgi:hypothetical protein
MTTNRFKRTIGLQVAGVAIAAMALTLPGAAVAAGGIRNCADVTGTAAAHVACYETVWSGGVQYRMTFFAQNSAFPGGTPSDRTGSMYLVAPQTDIFQGTLPFAHDHVVGGVPRQNGGDYQVILHAWFAFCSSDQCTSGTTPTPFGAPFARTVNGHPLTSAEAVESAADAGLVTLFDAGAAVVGTLGPRQ